MGGKLFDNNKGKRNKIGIDRFNGSSRSRLRFF